MSDGVNVAYHRHTVERAEAENRRLEALVRDAASWITAACQEHPGMLPPGWVVALREI